MDIVVEMRCAWLLTSMAGLIVTGYSPAQADLTINLGPEQDQITLPALVIDVDPNSNEVYFLVITNDVPLDTLPEDLGGQIEIEVEYVTPFTLVRRASGTYFADNQIPVSPQEASEFQRE